MGRTTTHKSQLLTHQLDYQAAIDQVSQSAVYLLDAKCRVVSWNRGAEAIKGYTAEEVMGQPFFKFYPERDQSAGKPMEILHQAVRKGSVSEEGWRVRKDGGEFWAHIVTTALFDEQKKVKGFLKIVHNYSENKRLDNQRITLVETTQQQKRFINKQKTEIKNLEKQLQGALQKLQNDTKTKN
jgi:PAS domain S-box-containing protein